MRHGYSLPPPGGEAPAHPCRPAGGRHLGRGRTGPGVGDRSYLDRMCGRYATTRSGADLTALFDAADDTGGQVPTDYNVAPTKPVPIVRRSARLDGRALSVARWGLVPHWARDVRAGARMINARAERVATAPPFSPSFARRRCLVPADGWYEWRRQPSGKQAYFMTPRDDVPLTFAGIWTTWGPDRLLSCAVITAPAQGDLALVHDRMPVRVTPDRWERWLAGPVDPEELLSPLPPYRLASIEIRPVGPEVGDVRRNGPELTMATGSRWLSDLTLF